MTSNTFKREAYAQESDQVFIALITMTSDELAEPIRVCNDPFELIEGDRYGCISNGETFLFIPFDIWLPRDDKTGAVSAKITFENIDREIIPAARSVRKPINVKIQCVLSGAVDTVELEYDNFKLNNVKHNTLSVEGDLTLNYWGLEPFPSYKFTPAGFPGLF